ncbi:hypothetical protein GUJ93_ZPchr0010g9873 [Zizania palustris]|uniref:R3H domain-containing protein n=1 Tax=Zizania palustris TaxID=103762 RepID=A0A8J5WBX6_ZIZPA|nr:hypothetical protein GUJ93_ZPchr0010g9873 [Zizania palustris]
MSSGTTSSPPPVADEGRVTEFDGRVTSHVDPFLVEALDNPRHRLMVLRMEMDIRKFMQNPELHEFEFQHFPTSYLRCAAHRVAQHYGTSDLGALSIARDEPVNVEPPPVDENKVNTMNSRSRVAVFKDTEKDRSDPDYDRNYKRYVRSPVHDFNMSPGGFNFVVPQFMQYGVGFMPSANMSRNQPSVYFGQPDLSMGSSSGTAVYPQWPTPAMIYPHCYDNLGHMISQVPVYQSFNHG